MNPTNSAGALQQLQDYQKTAKTPDQAFTDANAQFGVPGAQQALTGLRGAIQQTTSVLNNVAPSVMGRTGNSLVTSAQANRIIGNEQAPIQTSLGKLGTDYGNAQQDFQNAEGQAATRAQATLTGQQGQLSYLQQLYSSLVDQEQKAAAAAEQKRQFDVEQARLRAGSGGGGGLSDFVNRSNPTKNSPAVAASTDPSDQYFTIIQQLRQSPNGVSKWNWGALANEFKNRGIDVSHGSAADAALNRYFAAAGPTGAQSSAPSGSVRGLKGGVLTI